MLPYIYMKYIKLFENYYGVVESLGIARKLYLDTNKIPPDIFEEIKNSDPSKTFKYVKRMVEFYLKDNPSIEELKNVILSFDDLVKRNQIKKSDINQYYTFQEVKDIVDLVKSSYTQKQQQNKEYKAKSSDIDLIHEDDRVLVLIPRTREAIKKYGKGTKWCITEDDPRYYNTYKRSFTTHIYIIMKNMDSSIPEYKMVVNFDKKGRVFCYDSLDKRIPLKRVIEVSGLKRKLFFPSPNKLTKDEELFLEIKSELEKEGPLDLEFILYSISQMDDVNIVDVKFDDTLLSLVVWSQLPDAVRLLIKKGANPNKSVLSGNSPLNFASWRGNVEIVKMLVNANANINHKGEGGLTPLISAIFNGNIEIAEFLINQGADLNIQDDVQKRNALHVAVWKERHSIIRQLINAGIDITLQDEDGETAWDWASDSIKKMIPELNPKNIETV